MQLPHSALIYQYISKLKAQSKENLAFVEIISGDGLAKDGEVLVLPLPRGHKLASHARVKLRWSGHHFAKDDLGRRKMLAVYTAENIIISPLLFCCL